MSRLIDLDQQIIVPICDETKDGMTYETQMSIAQMFDKFLDGFQPEIIDAVPVEWLRKVMYDADDAGDMEMTDAVSQLIQEWHRQEVI